MHEGGYRIELTGGGVTVHRPGRPPLVGVPPQPATGPGIVEQNLEQLVTLGPSTIIPTWDGSPLRRDDLSWALASLHQQRHLAKERRAATFS